MPDINISKKSSYTFTNSIKIGNHDNVTVDQTKNDEIYLSFSLGKLNNMQNDYTF